MTSRSEYTWDMAIKDLALVSPVTMKQATNLVWRLQGLVHPYDVVPILINMLGHLGHVDGDGNELGHWLALLMKEVKHDHE